MGRDRVVECGGGASQGKRSKHGGNRRGLLVRRNELQQETAARRDKVAFNALTLGWVWINVVLNMERPQSIFIFSLFSVGRRVSDVV